MKNIMQKIKPFSLITLCFIAIMMISKMFDCNAIDTLLKTEFHSLVTSCFMASVVFVVYLLLRLISVKCADWIVSILYGRIEHLYS